MLVSICIPCYNAAVYLAETLEALLLQNHHNLEIIIVDDNSTDGSLDILKHYKIKDHRIKFYLAKSKGAAAARNQAYKLSNGEFIVFFDADDWIPVDFIATQIASIQSQQEVVVAKWGRFYRNDLSTIQIDPQQLKKDLTFEEWIMNYWATISHMTCPGRVLIPKNLIEQTSLWDEHLSLNDDFTFYTKVFSNSDIIRYNNNSVFYYRSGVNGLSSRKGNFAFLSLYQSITTAITIAQSKLKESIRLNKCYANLLQHFIYETYPNKSDLIKKAECSIKALGGSDLKFPVGGKTKILNSILGWKLVKQIKSLRLL